MIAKLFGKEAASAALTIALTGTIAVLVAKGGNPLSLKRIVAGSLSNPVPRDGQARPARRVFEESAVGIPT